MYLKNFKNMFVFPLSSGPSQVLMSARQGLRLSGHTLLSFFHFKRFINSLRTVIKKEQLCFYTT